MTKLVVQGVLVFAAAGLLLLLARQERRDAAAGFTCGRVLSVLGMVLVVGVAVFVVARVGQPVTLDVTR